MMSYLEAVIRQRLIRDVNDDLFDPGSLGIFNVNPVAALVDYAYLRLGVQIAERIPYLSSRIPEPLLPEPAPFSFRR